MERNTQKGMLESIVFGKEYHASCALVHLKNPSGNFLKDISDSPLGHVCLWIKIPETLLKTQRPLKTRKLQKIGWFPPQKATCLLREIHLDRPTGCPLLVFFGLPPAYWSPDKSDPFGGKETPNITETDGKNLSIPGEGNIRKRDLGKVFALAGLLESWSTQGVAHRSLPKTSSSIYPTAWGKRFSVSPFAEKKNILRIAWPKHHGTNTSQLPSTKTRKKQPCERQQQKRISRKTKEISPWKNAKGNEMNLTKKKEELIFQEQLRQEKCDSVQKKSHLHKEWSSKERKKECIFQKKNGRRSRNKQSRRMTWIREYSSNGTGVALPGEKNLFFLFVWPDGKESFLALYCTYRNAANESLLRVSPFPPATRLESHAKFGSSLPKKTSESRAREKIQCKRNGSLT